MLDAYLLRDVYHLIYLLVSKGIIDACIYFPLEFTQVSEQNNTH